MPRAALLAAVSLLVALTSSVLVALPAAADAEGSTVTWSVAPADAGGPDGRARMELTLSPGTSTTEHLAVHNFGDQAVTFALSAADGYFTATGRFNMLASGVPSVAAGTWITIDEEVTVGPGDTTVVPFTIAVPQEATPGDHAAGVAASVMSTSSEGGTQLGVESRVGFRVMVRVPGEIAPSLTVTSQGEYRPSWNPFAPGTLEVTSTIENTGNVQLVLEPGDERSWRTTAGGSGLPTELLPGDERVLTSSVTEVWPLGRITRPLQFAAGSVAPDGTVVPVDAGEHTVSAWALPLPQLVLAGGLVVIVLALHRARRRRADRLEEMLAAAREAGHREALGEQT